MGHGQGLSRYEAAWVFSLGYWGSPRWMPTMAKTPRWWPMRFSSGLLLCWPQSGLSIRDGQGRRLL